MKLAINGGQSALNAVARFQWPIITEATKQAVLEQLDRTISIYDNGDIFGVFEERFSAFHGGGYTLLTSSGTAALHTLFFSIGLEPGDEILVPAYTFFATASPVFQTGAMPVLVDCDETGNLDPAKIESLISERTKALVVTHMWGVPADMPRITSICREKGILLLEDCSHAHGAIIDGQMVGTFGDGAAWSLQGQKLLTAGEGGIVLSRSRKLYERAVFFGQYNKRCKQELSAESPLREFSVTGAGLKLRAHPLAIAIANQQLDCLPAWLENKRKFARMAMDLLEGCPGLSLPKIYQNSQPSWYAMVFQYKQSELGGVSIEKFHQAVLAEGVDADLPRSTCPLGRLALFQRPWEIYPSYAGARLNLEAPVADDFSSRAFKINVGALDSEESLMLSCAVAIRKVAENYKELL